MSTPKGAMNKGEMNKAAESVKQVITNFNKGKERDFWREALKGEPNTPALCKFFIGLVFDNNLKDLATYVERFTRILNKSHLRPATKCTLDEEFVIYKPLEGALYAAAEVGNTKALEILLKDTGLHPDFCNTFRQTALSSACFNGHPEAVHFLLSAGANPYLKGKDFRYPLHFACLPKICTPTEPMAPGVVLSVPIPESEQAKYANIVNLLLSHTAHAPIPNITTLNLAPSGSSVITAFTFALEANNVQVIKTLINHTSVLDRTFIKSLLTQTINLFRLQILQELLNLSNFPKLRHLLIEELQTNPEHFDSILGSALKEPVVATIAHHVATGLELKILQENNAVNSVGLLKLLLSLGVKPTLKNLHTAIEIDLESEWGKFKNFIKADQVTKQATLITKMLLETNTIEVDQCYQDIPALQRATQYGRVEIMRSLLASKAKVNALNTEGVTALHQAAGRQPQVVEFLIQAGANIDAQSYAYRTTPLIIAIYFNQTQAAHLLLKAKANVNIVDNYHRSPLSLALRFPDDKLGQAIFDHGAILKLVRSKEDPWAFTSDEAGEIPNPFFVLSASFSPLLVAAFNGHIELVKRIFNSKVFLELPPETQKALFNEAAIVTIFGSQRRAFDYMMSIRGKDCEKLLSDLVRAAVIEEKLEFLEILLPLIADVNVPDAQGNTSLMLAVHNSKIVEILLKTGRCQTNAVNIHNKTALHMACGEGNYLDSVNLLLDAGADTDIQDANQMTPFMVAAIEGRGEILRNICKKRKVDLEQTDFQGLTVFQKAHPSVVEILTELGAKTPVNGAYRINHNLITAMFKQDREIILQYIPYVDVNLPLLLPKEMLDALGSYYQSPAHCRVIIIATSHQVPLDIQAIVLKHSWYKLHPEIPRNTIDIAVDHLAKIANKFLFSTQGVLVVRLKQDSNDYFTLPPYNRSRLILSDFSKSRMLPDLKAFFRNFSLEGEAEKEAERDQALLIEEKARLEAIEREKEAKIRQEALAAEHESERLDNIRIRLELSITREMDRQFEKLRILEQKSSAGDPNLPEISFLKNTKHIELKKERDEIRKTESLQAKIDAYEKLLNKITTEFSNPIAELEKSQIGSHSASGHGKSKSKQKAKQKRNKKTKWGDLSQLGDSSQHSGSASDARPAGSASERKRGLEKVESKDRAKVDPKERAVELPTSKQEPLVAHLAMPALTPLTAPTPALLSPAALPAEPQPELGDLHKITGIPAKQSVATPPSVSRPPMPAPLMNPSSIEAFQLLATQFGFNLGVQIDRKERHERHKIKLESAFKTEKQSIAKSLGGNFIIDGVEQIEGQKAQLPSSQSGEEGREKKESKEKIDAKDMKESKDLKESRQNTEDQRREEIRRRIEAARKEDEHRRRIEAARKEGKQISEQHQASPHSTFSMYRASDVNDLLATFGGSASIPSPTQSVPSYKRKTAAQDRQ